MRTITLTEAINLLKTHRKSGTGRIFSAEFTKKDGDTKVANGRFNVTAHLKGGEPAYDREAAGVLCYYDINSKGYRNINLAGLKWVQVDGEKVAVA
jgi:hypothetical protein